jgi:hypothetical protein
VTADLSWLTWDLVLRLWWLWLAVAMALGLPALGMRR